MSIVKHVSGKNTSRKYIKEVTDYLVEPHKTADSQYVGTYGCGRADPIRDMTAVKQSYHKLGGKQGEHFVISLTPDRKEIKNSTYMEIAELIAPYLGDFQSIYALHLDSKVRHIHFLLNGVSYKDGKKFSMGPDDLNQFKTDCNRILNKYGYDPIRIGGLKLEDNTPYEINGDFSFLEVEDEPEEEQTSYNSDNIIADYDEDGPYSDPDYIRYATSSNNYRGCECDDDDYDGYGYDYEEDDNYNKEDYNMSKNSLKVNKVPEYLSKREKKVKSKLVLNNSRNFNINVDSEDKLLKCYDAFDNIKDKNMEDKLNDTKVAMSALARLNDNGYDFDVELDNSVNLNICFIDAEEDSSSNDELPDNFNVVDLDRSEYNEWP